MAHCFVVANGRVGDGGAVPRGPESRVPQPGMEGAARGRLVTQAGF